MDASHTIQNDVQVGGMKEEKKGSEVMAYAPYNEQRIDSVPGSTKVAAVTVNFLTLSQRNRRSMQAAMLV